MKNSKKTKRAFLLSVLSVVLCVAMLAGTTFAWFTDSESATKNIIKSGNLDVELLKEDGTEVQIDDNLFPEDALWEPGHVETVTLTVKNAGTLALKYNLKLSKVSEKEGVSVLEEKPLKLSNYMKYAVVDGKPEFGEGKEGREAAIAAAEANRPSKLTSVSYSKKGVLNEKGDTQVVTLIVYMPTTIGNEANYLTGKTAEETENNRPEITLGVDLIATQVEHENDSFGNDYDASLVAANTRSDVNSNMSNNAVKEIIVDSDISDALRITDSIGSKDKIVNFGDNTMTFTQEGAFLFRRGPKTITFAGEDGGIVAPHEVLWNSSETVTVNITGGNYKATAEGDGVEVIYCEKGTVNISGGFFETPGNKAPTFLLNCKDANRAAGTAKIVVTGGTFVNFDPSNNAAEGAGTNFVAEGYKVNKKTQKNGDVWYTVVKA